MNKTTLELTTVQTASGFVIIDSSTYNPDLEHEVYKIEITLPNMSTPICVPYACITNITSSSLQLTDQVLSSIPDGLYTIKIYTNCGDLTAYHMQITVELDTCDPDVTYLNEAALAKELVKQGYIEEGVTVYNNLKQQDCEYC